MKEQVEHALKRREGMSAEARKALEREILEADDLFTTCQKCGQQIRGTLKQLEGHDCG